MRLPEISRTIEVPDDVNVSLEGKKVIVKGAKGSLTRDFSHAPVSIDSEGKNIRVWAKWPRKKEAALVGTIESHIKNMITGVTKGYSYKMKIVFSHFPITVKYQNKNVIIENFTGERRARKVKLIGDVKVKIESEDIIIEGINLEDVSQSAANIEQSTKVRRKDPRVFLDGIYTYERNEGMA
ncbi:MAG: 50S ribosomal protein L6 [Candidatus Bathyarchaeota archaeon]|jgi:large subunit ribosomal protein L6|nr:50S ribosomal protein L6 [Candidatus Bathyarchaeota archaeon]